MTAHIQRNNSTELAQPNHNFLDPFLAPPTREPMHHHESACRIAI
jgi:hypothetical protein